MKYWLLKTEPDVYSIEDLKRDGRAMWDGVRNIKANNYIKKMEIGDYVFIYHTGKERSIVGIGKIVTSSYPDPTSDNPKFHAIDVEYVKRLVNPVTLKEIKESLSFTDWELVNLPRLSVMPVKVEYWHKVLTLAGDNFEI
ncbi:EVE domain-containing protein [Anaerobranca gottschalkii]|uniref:Predicted RNA-binding protein, contains PUA-like domain n=1 Tax=Anaerobranca gottschalkii DSM 13577 TaxID=1120990 RepID=A0A1I0CES6_9FIRM|nr:EVE domain-containing protein [Anaerobranca gottschalkii]SET18089.1 Predicted RNA-binding protein, contains PUA-like domain [Anaerobranca gottschalkii DSM 13577]